MHQGIFEVPRKTIAIELRWVVIIACSFLLLFSEAASSFQLKIHGFIFLYILSNIELYFLDEKLFEDSYFYAPLVLSDTFFLTASLMLSGQVSTDFYLVYFLMAILCVVLQDFVGAIVTAALLTAAYGYLIFSGPVGNDPSIYLRLPFLFVVSIFYAYFALLVRAERSRREEAERRVVIAQALAETERLKSEFVRNATHELRTPLTAIMGYTGLMLDGGFGPLSEAQKKTMAKLMESARGLFGLIEQLLEFSKIEKGETNLATSQYDLAAFLRELRGELGFLEAERPYQVQYQAESNLPVIETDWQKLKNILKSIIGNAVKFTEKGEVRLSVSSRPTGEIAFAVSDTGIGIPKDQVPLIFEMFRQLDGSQTRRYGGTGLGLAIAKNLADLIGGRIEVESEVGRGSTFTVTIPARPPVEERFGFGLSLEPG